jgi:hypothetical protein
MTATPVRVRRVEDIDRDIDTARRERGRTLVQIDQYLSSVVALRAKYSRAGDRIDVLLEERVGMTASPSPTPEVPA